jgi:HSP20 family protein
MTLVKNNHEVKEFIPRSFTDILDNFFNESLESGKSFRYVPSTDIVEDEKNFEVSISLPGLKKEEIKIEINERKLIVSGERKFEKQEGKKYHTMETRYGSFKRSFYLPDTIHTDSIRAEFTDGILKISLPKDEKKIGKTIVEIK